MWDALRAPYEVNFKFCREQPFFTFDFLPYAVVEVQTRFVSWHTHTKWTEIANYVTSDLISEFAWNERSFVAIQRKCDFLQLCGTRWMRSIDVKNKISLGMFGFDFVRVLYGIKAKLNMKNCKFLKLKRKVESSALRTVKIECDAPIKRSADSSSGVGETRNNSSLQKLSCY